MGTFLKELISDGLIILIKMNNNHHSSNRHSYKEYYHNNNTFMGKRHRDDEHYKDREDEDRYSYKSNIFILKTQSNRSSLQQL